CILSWIFAVHGICMHVSCVVTGPSLGPPLSLHAALPILQLEKENPDITPDQQAEIFKYLYDTPLQIYGAPLPTDDELLSKDTERPEEHTSELQSRFELVWRLLPEKKRQSRSDSLRDPTTH